MAKITDIQLVILSTAAQRDDGAALPLPKSLKLQGGAAATSLKSMLKKGWLQERPAAAGEPAWRETGNGRMTLFIATSGLSAIGIESESAEGVKPAEEIETKGRPDGKSGNVITLATKFKRPATRPNTKQASLIALLRRKRGATIAELSDATGWQAHSVRGAISGTLKKKLGLIVASEAVDGRGRVYRIVEGA